MSLAAARHSPPDAGAARDGWRAIIAIALLVAASIAVMARASLEPRDLKGHGGPVKAIAVSPDGKRALTGSFDYAVMVWNLGDEPQLAQRFFDHEAAVNAVAFAAGGRRAVTGSDDATVGVFDLDTGRPITRFFGHAMKVSAVAVAPDGRWLASASWDRTARLWDLETLKAGPVLAGHTGAVNTLAFTADGRHVLTGGYDGTLRLWRVADGTQARIVYRHGWGLNVIKVLADGANVLFGGLDGTIGLIDLDTGEVERIIARRERPVLALALNGDQTLAAAAGGDGVVEVFDAAAWQVLRALDNPYGPVWALAFTGDDDALYMGGLDDEVHYWQFRPGRAFEPVSGEFPRRFQVSAGVSAGELQFRRKCSICHTLARDGGNRAGPTLYGIFGRRAGTVAGYAYSAALSGSQIVWSEETIARLFAEGPEHYIPGTKMPLQKMTVADDRAALIAYLKETAGQPPEGRSKP